MSNIIKRMQQLATLILLFAGTGTNAQIDTSAFVYSKPLFDFDYTKSLFKLQNEQLTNKNRFLRYAAFTGYREGVAPIKNSFVNWSSTLNNENGTSNFKMYNLSIQDMLTYGQMKSSRVILNVKDPSKYRYDHKNGSYEKWLRKNGYCFELTIPQGLSNINGRPAVLRMVMDELCHFFKVNYERKKILAKTLVLVRTSNREKFKTAGGPVSFDLIKGNYTNTDFVTLNESFYQYSNLPFKVEADYKGMIDLQLNIQDWTDISAVRKALQRYDLDLKEEMREMDMIIITEL